MYILDIRKAPLLDCPGSPQTDAENHSEFSWAARSSSVSQSSSQSVTHPVIHSFTHSVSQLALGGLSFLFSNPFGIRR